MMAVTVERFYVSGLRAISRKVVHNCVPCRRTNATPCTQQMGQLPADRVRPAPQFQSIGLDYSGPFIVRTGYTRKPIYEKAYVCIYVCTVTKAMHLELVGDLSTDRHSAYSLTEGAALRMSTVVMDVPNASSKL